MSRHDERTPEQHAQVARNSPLFQLLDDRKRRGPVLDALYRLVHSIYPGKHQQDYVQEIIASTITRALGQEGTPNAWDPNKEPAHDRLIRAFDNERSDRSRARERKPTVRLVGTAYASAAPNPEQEAAVADEERVRAQLADEAYDHLEENTDTGLHLTTRILDRLREEKLTHEQLAIEFGVKLSDIQNACKRIRNAAVIVRKRHDQRVSEEERKQKELDEARPRERRA